MEVLVQLQGLCLCCISTVYSLMAMHFGMIPCAISRGTTFSLEITPLFLYRSNTN